MDPPFPTNPGEVQETHHSDYDVFNEKTMMQPKVSAFNNRKKDWERQDLILGKYHHIPDHLCKLQDYTIKEEEKIH